MSQEHTFCERPPSRAGAETIVCPSCAGSRCELGECEPCMHGDCSDRCIDDICRGSGWHVDCRNCEGTGRIDHDDDDWEDDPSGFHTE